MELGYKLREADHNKYGLYGERKTRRQRVRSSDKERQREAESHIDRDRENKKERDREREEEERRESLRFSQSSGKRVHGRKLYLSCCSEC